MFGTGGSDCQAGPARAGEAERFAAWLRAGSPRTPDPARLVRDAFEYAARAVSRTRADAEPVACERGCAHCCHLPVWTTSAEAEVLAGALRALPAPTRARVESAALDAARAYPAADRAPAAGVRVPCPALVDGACAAYAARPLACRGWNSTDAAACEAALSSADDTPRIPSRMRLRAVHASTAGALARGLGDETYLAPALARLVPGR